MFALLSPRLWVGLALAGVLAFTHLGAYRSGRGAVRVLWDKERAVMTAQALQASEAARAKEKTLIVENQKVSEKYAAEKKRRAADSVANAGKLRDLQAALASAAGDNPPAGSSADDPRNRIIDECASAAVALDGYAKGLASQVTGLQGYASQVCVSKPG